MKKIFLAVLMLGTALSNAQAVHEFAESKINVAGEGKVMVMPDEANITIGVENSGIDAKTVKKENDAVASAIIKYLKGIKLPEKDYQTQRVYLNRSYDQDNKTYQYVATQTIKIHLRDLSQYDAIMMGLVDAGANNIQGVEFLSSKMEQYESEARVKAVQDAKQKATDYAGALGVKLGRVVEVTDNSQSYYPMRAMSFKAAADNADQTLAVGEITVTANVNITYALE